MNSKQRQMFHMHYRDIGHSISNLRDNKHNDICNNSDNYTVNVNTISVSKAKINIVVIVKTQFPTAKYLGEQTYFFISLQVSTLSYER